MQACKGKTAYKKGNLYEKHQKNSAEHVDALNPGDVSGNDKIDNVDVETVAQHLAECLAEAMTEQQLKAADVHSDGVVDIKDLIKLAQMAAIE